MFTFPIDHQLDVPVGSNIVVTFSEKVVASAASSVKLVGADGTPFDATATVTDEGTGVIFSGPALAPGTTYGVVVGSAIDPSAKNLPTSGPLFSFTTRSATPKSAAPSLIAIQGTDPALFATAPHRPLFETSTIRLVFSEPIDPRSVVDDPASIQLVDGATNMPVPAVVVANGIHVSIDPVDDLAAGQTYTLKLGNRIRDLDGHTFIPAQIPLTPLATRGTVIKQILRTRGATDPGPKQTRSGAARNTIAIDKPLIGKTTSNLNNSALHAELGNPKALDGPIAFTIRKGQRLTASGLDVKLDGAIPSGLATGDIQIEILTDADGRLYRNPYQAAGQRPENQNAPVYVDLVLDVAVYATDPGGNAVLAQTILGIQATGTAVATDGVLAIETVAAMDFGLLGIATAPSNFVMELITDPAGVPAVDSDTAAPTMLASYPEAETDGQPVGAGIEVIFDEPIDLARANAGGVRLTDASNGDVAAVIESHGAAIVVRPLAPLKYSSRYHIVLADVADQSGNAAVGTTFAFSTEALQNTNIPITVSSVYPGAACTLTGGHCTGGKSSDDSYHPFTLPANEPIEVGFTQPLVANTIALGTACGKGTVRVEEFAGGTCKAAVPGTLIRRDRSLQFVPDVPWTPGTTYRLSLISGNNSGCDANEICGISGDAASFDPLNGMTNGDGGGNNLSIDFAGAPASTSTFMVAETTPFTDINGSGTVDGAEALRDENRAALRITDHSGIVTNAQFNSDCDPSTPEHEACMYLQGGMPVEMGELSTSCPLPDGSSAASCIPVKISAQTMYATSITMAATIAGIATINTDTKTSVMRVREPAGGPLMGYIVDRNGTPTMITALELYMDAHDMSLPLSSHDLHSKPMSLILVGPVTFLADGRIAIALTNTADVEIDVNISSITAGQVKMLLAKDQMKLQLLSRPIRGVER